MDKLAEALRYHPFSGDETPVRVLRDAIVAAKYPHKCFHCRGPISKAEKHRAMTEINLDDRVVVTTRFCNACTMAQANSFADAGKELDRRFFMTSKAGA